MHNGQRIFPTVSNSAILSNDYVSLLGDRLSAHAYKRENGVTNEAIVIEWAAAAPGGSEKAMGRCMHCLVENAAVSCENHHDRLRQR